MQTTHSSLPSCSSAAITTPLPFLKKQLQRVANARPNSYARKLAILVHWEEDESNAKEDINTMEAIMKTFGIQSIVHTLRQKGPATIWNLLSRIQKMLGECHATDENCLFVFYYAGHGSIEEGSLHFAPIEGVSSQSSVEWSRVSATLSDEHLTKIDVFTVLDCCFSGLATRSSSRRVCHIIAACGYNESTTARGWSISFTQRIFRAVQHLRSATHTTTAELFAEIQRQKPKLAPNAVFKTLGGGAQPIKLLFSPAGSQSLSSSPSRIPRLAASKNVLVKLTMKGDGHHAFSTFKEAITGLPDVLSVDVLDAYDTDHSFFVLLKMTWECLCYWSTVLDVELVGVIHGPSLVHRELAEIPTRGRNENRKENRQATGQEKTE
ncbi:uncharacterized protein N7511_009208 [Penicillium nucicola]|uniref:uncharacterized protein n=1 Tax=Penicillium nucicola TaxID=1850975 RepID=UPI00254564AA|nr:uncharacterized protein N7511_009208 [Penicillium nucicola]KAJ5747512.1 hypothetical protein N7511_009208 [Penicillium nucicola]